MASVTVRVKTPQGAAVCGASVLMAYPDGRYRIGLTDADGDCELDLYRTDVEMLVLVAAREHLSFEERITLKDREVIPVELKPSREGLHSILFTKSTGYIPGIEGRLNPHKDGYFYADNIAVNGRLGTPAVKFDIDEPLELLDIYGVETTIRFKYVEGQYSLIEYTTPDPYTV